MEVKRSINNKSYLFCIGSIILCFILGYILLVSIDKIEQVQLNQLLLSVYTVLTQFGMMVFPFVTIYSINVDYKEKNILFYRNFNIGPIKYFLSKVASSMLWFTIIIIVSIFSISIYYRDFTFLLPTILLYVSVLFYTTIISSCFAFIFKNMLAAFGVNFFMWIGSIVLGTIFIGFKYVAYFDASKSLYSYVDDYYSLGNPIASQLFESTVYNIVTFTIVIVIIRILSYKWLENGINN